MSHDLLCKKILKGIKSVVGHKSAVLHEPWFDDMEISYLKKCIKNNFVSSVGPDVKKFENKIKNFTGAKHAIATINGTSALHISLLLSGVSRNDEVLIPALNYIASANATAYLGALPHFVDVEEDTLSVDVDKLDQYLKKITKKINGKCHNKITGREIKAIVVTHIFGHPGKMDKLILLSKEYNLKLIEDAAEGIGSLFKKKHVGTFGLMGILSFNGNKTITTGAGGAILTNSTKLAKLITHVSSIAKLQHRWEYKYDRVGYNYRMPNINAALGCAQLNKISKFITAKRKLFKKYKKVFKKINEIKILEEPSNCRSNYWLQTIIIKKSNLIKRNSILKFTNKAGFKTRPIWTLLNKNLQFVNCPKMDLSKAKELETKIINLPSSSQLCMKI